MVAAIALAAPLLRTLGQSGHVRANYREREVVFPLGVLSVVAALVALVPLAVLERLEATTVFYADVGAVTVYALGVAFLGLVDD
ncbi:MAG TPA: hypothetical protein VIG42_04055, partial [Solirubrobacteraceae bacterium]